MTDSWWNLNAYRRSNKHESTTLSDGSRSDRRDPCRCLRLESPSESDGPIRLLACVVGSDGVLEAEVDNRSEDAMNCNIRCNYEFGERPFFHWFEVMIPARFSGRVGRFDTSNGKAGRYSGDVGTCKKRKRAAVATVTRSPDVDRSTRRQTCCVAPGSVAP